MISTRKQYVKVKKIVGALLITTLLASALSLSGSAVEKNLGDWWQKFDFTKYKGTTLRIIALPPEPITAYRDAFMEFEEVSGVKIKFEEYSYGRIRDKVLIELMTGGQHVDLFWNQPYVQGLQFYKAGYYEPVNKYISDESLTNPDWRLEDFSPGLLKLGTFANGLIGVPVQLETNLLWYRLDLLEKYGVSVPDTFEEFRSAAEKLTLDTNGDGQTDIYGVTQRAEYSLLHVANLLYGYGGDFFDSKGNVTINSPEAVQAISMYVDILRNYGPPGIIGWKETINMFTSGKAALMMGSNLRLPYFTNPETSEIIGKFRAGLVPRGPVAREPLCTGWFVSISYGSPNKEIAWLALHYALGKKTYDKMIMVGWSPPYMPSWKLPEAKEKVPSWWLESSLESMKITKGRAYVPRCVQGVEARAIIERAITLALEGKKDVQEALDEAASEVEKVLLPGEFEWHD